MSVTKIRKTSSWTLLAITLISLVVLGIYYFGGVVDPAAEMVEPIFSGLLISHGDLAISISKIKMNTSDSAPCSLPA